MLVLSYKINGALLVYHILAVELDGLGQTVTLAPPAVDAVSTVIRLHKIIFALYRKFSEGSRPLLHHRKIYPICNDNN